MLKDLSIVSWHEISDADTVDVALYTFEALLTDVRYIHALRNAVSEGVKSHHG